MNYSFLFRGFFRLLVLSWTCFGLSFSLFAESGFEEWRPKAIEILRNELGQAEGWVKVHAAESLLELGYLDGVKERFEEALERLRTSEDPITRLRAAFVWSRLTPLTREEWLCEGGGESLKLDLADGLPAVRIQACRVLGQVGRPDEASWVIPLFDDPHPDVRIYAADALLRMERRQSHEMVVVDWMVLVGLMPRECWGLAGITVAKRVNSYEKI